MLVMQSVARFEVGREGYRGRAQTRLRGGLPREKVLFHAVNGDMATRSLTSASGIASDIERRSSMLGVAIRTADLLVLMDSAGFLIRMTGLAISVRDPRETGMTLFTAESGVSCRQGTGAIGRVPLRGERDRGPAQNS